jgi:hypothetical protein
MSCKTEELSIDLLERVLMRLGLSDRPAPTFDGLQTLYAAWCRKVPFDNVRKLIHIHNHDPGPLPGDDATDFFEAWLTYGTGARVGPAMERCTPCSRRWAFTRLVGWAPCSLLHIYHRTMAPCSSPMTRRTISLMPRCYTANHYTSTRTRPPPSRIRPGACNAARAMVIGIFAGTLRIC